MSEGWSKEKRCIVKTLNFEDCVPTNLKTKGKKLKKLRATLSREIKDPFLSSEKEKKRKCDIFEESPNTLSPVLTQKCGRPKILKSSPVLAKKRLIMPGSPVFYNKRKQLFSGTTVEHDSESATPYSIISEPNKTSPVFKSKKRVKGCSDLFAAYDAVQAPSGKTISVTIEDDEEGSYRSRIDISSSRETQESNEMKIESCGGSQESEAGEESDISDCTSEPESENALKNPPPAGMKTPVKLDQETEKTDSNLDSGKKKTKFTKNSLSERLDKLNKLQMSERRIWEHEREIMKTDRSIKEKFSVISFWQDENLFTIKCRNLDKTDQYLIIIINGDVVPKAHKIKENSVISISPPWQKMHLLELNSDVILSAVCVEVKGEFANPARREIVREPTDVEQWKRDDSLFINCLFSLPS